MFKKPLADLKTSCEYEGSFRFHKDLISFIAPLRSSDRRKLKQRICQTYSLSPEIGETLVPEGLLTQKFSTHLQEHGVSLHLC